MKRVLLTGASGFTGKYLKPLLEANMFEVHEFDCDLTDALAVINHVEKTKPHYIVHLAALSYVGEKEQKSFYDVNLFGTLNLLEALKHLKQVPIKIIIASSANIYGDTIKDQIDENVLPKPLNHYANSKLAMEHMVRLYFDSLPILITRPFNYTGIGQNPKFLVPKIVEHYRAKKSVIELGNLDVVRDFSDVEEVSQCYLKLLLSNQHSEIVNICSGRGTSLKVIIERMNKIASYSPEVKINPDFVRPNELKRLIGNPSKLEKMIDFKPSNSIKSILQKMFKE